MATTRPTVPRQWAQHPATWLPSGIFAIIWGIAALACLVQTFTMVFWGVGVLLFGSFAAGCAWAFIRGIRRIWTLDGSKITEKYDGISYSNEVLYYHRISEVAIYQGMWGRIFGYGTIVLTLQGRDNKWYVPNAPRPRALHTFFSAVAEENNQQRSYQ